MCKGVKGVKRGKTIAEMIKYINENADKIFPTPDLDELQILVTAIEELVAARLEAAAKTQMSPENVAKVVEECGIEKVEQMGEKFDQEQLRIVKKGFALLIHGYSTEATLPSGNVGGG